MAGYIEITVNGEITPIRFGLPAIKIISDKIDLLRGQEEITLNIMSMVHILYAGYVNDCLANDRTIIHEFRTFYEYVENAALTNQMEDIKKVINVFVGSKEVKDTSDGGEKKKTGKPKK